MTGPIPRKDLEFYYGRPVDCFRNGEWRIYFTEDYFIGQLKTDHRMTVEAVVDMELTYFKELSQPK